MSWTMSDHPPALDSLSESTLRAAIEIGNDLLEHGAPEERAISMAAARARARTEDGEEPAQAAELHLLPGCDGNWELRFDDPSINEQVHPSFEAALKRGCELAAEAHTALYVYDLDGHLIDRFVYFGGDSVEGDWEVVPHETSWAATRRGSRTDFRRFHTKADAVAYARQRARRDETRLHVRYASGKNQHTYQYAHA